MQSTTILLGMMDLTSSNFCSEKKHSNRPGSAVAPAWITAKRPGAEVTEAEFLEVECSESDWLSSTSHPLQISKAPRPRTPHISSPPLLSLYAQQLRWCFSITAAATKRCGTSSEGHNPHTMLRSATNGCTCACRVQGAVPCAVVHSPPKEGTEVCSIRDEDTAWCVTKDMSHTMCTLTPTCFHSSGVGGASSIWAFKRVWR